MAVVVDDVDRAGVYARSPQGRRVQPAATNRHSHICTRRWCIGGLAVKQDAYDRSRDFPAQSIAVGESRWILASIRFLGGMSDLWIGDVGIRVTTLEKSIEFCTKMSDREQC